MVIIWTSVRSGSPPRVRGKSAALRDFYGIDGITPACAGKITRMTRRVILTRDHPRVCGENGLLKSSFATDKGSPPRVRGKCVDAINPLCVAGITPACAGKIQVTAEHKVVERDHPRVCGENTQWKSLLASSAGSPPRVRGKSSLLQWTSLPKGITPACAGKISAKRAEKLQRGDHPRVCGENTSEMAYFRG